jgi:hypothetical protein
MGIEKTSIQEIIPQMDEISLASNHDRKLFPDLSI